MIFGPENIAAVFSIFHDGRIDSFSRDHDQVKMKVEIQYLAERVNPSFRAFTLKLAGVSDLKFSTWPDDPSASAQIFTQDADIFVGELEILSGEANGNQIKVICNQPSTQYDHSGGELYFLAKSAEIADESGKIWSIAELEALSKDYWDDWSRRNERQDA